MIRYFNIPIVSTLIAVSLLATACSSENFDKEGRNTEPVFVSLASPSYTVENGVHASGQVESVETANISTRVMGQIMKINVKPGDQVKAGQVLLTINNQDMSAKGAQAKAMIAEADAHLKSAHKDYQRFTTLYEQQSASAKELDNVTLQYQAALARVEAAKQMHNEVKAIMAYTSLTAPFSGVVTQKIAEEGALASPGMPLLVIEKSDNFQVSASVAESEIGKIKLNSVVHLNIKSIGKEFDGRVSEISPSSQLSGGQYMIKVSIPPSQSKDLYAGMYVTIFVPVSGDESQSGESNSILVPRTAIVTKDQLNGLYTVSTNNTALLRWVRLGKVYGDDIEVLSGLDKTDQFIVSADGVLYNGVPVTLKN